MSINLCDKEVCYKGSALKPILRPSLGFLETGEKGHLFQGNKRQILRGTGEQRQYWRT